MTKPYTIIHDREACIGCGACASVCPEYWEMKDDGKSSIIQAEHFENLEFGEDKFESGETKNLDENFNCNNEAAESCPVNCIHLYQEEDSTSKKII